MVNVILIHSILFSDNYGGLIHNTNAFRFKVIPHVTIVDKSVVPLEFAGWAQGDSSTAQGNSS